jgi:hypothetical protein
MVRYRNREVKHLIHAAAASRRNTLALPRCTAVCQFAVKRQITETEVLRLTSLLQVTGPSGSKLTWMTFWGLWNGNTTLTRKFSSVLLQRKQTRIPHTQVHQAYADVLCSITTKPLHGQHSCAFSLRLSICWSEVGTSTNVTSTLAVHLKVMHYTGRTFFFVFIFLNTITHLCVCPSSLIKNKSSGM